MRNYVHVITMLAIAAAVGGCSAASMMALDKAGGDIKVGSVSEIVPDNEEFAVLPFEIPDANRFSCSEEERAYFVTAMVREINKSARWRARPGAAGTAKYFVRAQAVERKAWFRLYRDGRVDPIYEYSRSYSADDFNTKWFFSMAAEQFVQGLKDGHS